MFELINLGAPASLPAEMPVLPLELYTENNRPPTLGKEMPKCYNLVMTHAAQDPKILHADPEHGGLRLIVIIILLLGLILGFVIVQLLLNLLAADTLLIEFATVLSCSGAIVFALVAAWVSEVYLKQVWHSGTMLHLGESELILEMGKRQDDGETPQAKKMVFDWSKNVGLTRWYFELSGYARAGRERRVSSKWLCLACRIQQDSTQITVFGYLPPAKAAEWTENQHLSEPFHSLSLAYLYSEAGKRKRGAANRPAIPSSMLTGKDGPYWLAEQKRWQDGIELTQDDFVTLTSYIEQKR